MPNLPKNFDQSLENLDERSEVENTNKGKGALLTNEQVSSYLKTAKAGIK